MVLFLVLGICLFMGDGKQPLVDVVGSAGAICLFVGAKYWVKKQRDLPKSQTILWALFMFYMCVRIPFSDDAGYAIFNVQRFFDALILYDIFYCYSNKNTSTYLSKYIEFFALGALFISVIFTTSPFLAKTLPKMNLLIPYYGHNHIVDVLLFAVPIAWWKILSKPKTKINIFILVVLLIGLVFALSRAAIIISGIFMLIRWLWFNQKNPKTNKIIIAFAATLILIGLGEIVIPKIQSIFNDKNTISINTNKKPLFQDGRFEYWLQAIKAIKERPVFGSGPGTFYLQSKRLESTTNAYSWFAHNIILEIVVENGMIGLLFLTFILIEPIRKIVNIIRNNSHGIELVLSLIVIFVISLVDYSLNYLVIWFLWWVCLAVVVAENSKNQINTHNAHNLYSLQTTGLCFTIFFYVTNIINFVFPSFLIFQTINSFDAAKIYNQNPNNKILINFAYNLHRKNPEFLYDINDFCTAYKYDPQNKGYLNMCLKNITKYSLNQRSTILLDIASKFIPGQIKIFISSNKPKIATGLFEDKVFIHINGKETEVNYLGKIFYFVGLSHVDTNPILVKSLWTMARDLDPSWGYYHVELASLEKYIFNNNVQSKQFLKYCQKNKYSAELCQITLKYFDDMPKIGSYAENVKFIPKLLQ